MSSRVRFCWFTKCIVLVATFIPAERLMAQLNDTQNFEGTVGTYFAVPAGSVPYWSVDGGCSPAILYKDGARGDGGTMCLKSLMPVGIGTRMVRDLNPGPGSATIGEMGQSGLDTVYRPFVSASDSSGTNGQEFYRIVGGLYPVMKLEADINAGAGSSSPANMFQQWPGGLGNLFFSADDGTQGREPWLSTTAATSIVTNGMIMDINPGPGGSDPGSFRVAAVPNSARVVFAANDGTNGRELWETHIETPTPPATPYRTTSLLKDINTSSASASSDPQLLTMLMINTAAASFDIKAFFTADDGIHGRELWRTDGTAAGTGMVKEFVAGAAGSVVTNLTAGAPLVSGVVTPKLFFTVDSDGVTGMELWITSGALGGADTVQLKDTGSSPSFLTPSGTLMYFVSGNDLWKSDGTPGGTVLVKTFVSPPANLASIGAGSAAIVYFAADDGTGSGVELWKATTTSGASLVKDIQTGPGSSLPSNLKVAGANVAFTADDGVHGRELWRTDSTAGALLVKDINPGATGSDPSSLFAFDYDGSMLFFLADDGTHGRELWESDGFADPPHTGMNYKWDLASLIQSKGDPAMMAVAGTDDQPFSVYFGFDFPLMGGDGLSEAAHQINTYVEITDGTDRVPLTITSVDCGDGNMPRPKAALTDGSNHNAIAFGMVAVLDQDPCDTDSRGPSSPGVPFAYVPAVFDGLNWIPMDRAHIPPGTPSNPPAGTSLAQGPYSYPSWDPTLPGGLTDATSDPWAAKRFAQVRIDIWTDYIRVVWASKNTDTVYVATVPRLYKGAFKSLYFGNRACLQPPYPFYLDTVHVNGGVFACCAEPHGACCGGSNMTCTDVQTEAECVGGRFKPWKSCSETKICCPTPFADADFDGDVDQNDFGALQACYNGTGAAPAGCTCFNRDADTDVDSTDVTAFTNCFTGPNVPWSIGLTPSCVP